MESPNSGTVQRGSELTVIKPCQNDTQPLLPDIWNFSEFAQNIQVISKL